MEKHRHLTQEEQQAHIRQSIAWQGFAIQHVLASAHEPAFSYTVGLHTLGSQKPEVVMSGLKTETRVAWLLDIGFRIQGPPPLATRQQIVQAHGVLLETLVFPPGGAIFQPGKRDDDLAGHGLPTVFAEIDAQAYETYLGQAVAFHRSSAFPVLQLVWPDPHGFFPWFCEVDFSLQKQRVALALYRSQCTSASDSCVLILKRKQACEQMVVKELKAKRLPRLWDLLTFPCCQEYD